ncbi:MAG: hypothetical protein KAR40_13775 [Candidatus Sabulitectum sp.]|nr:hypothetical protein [Candidatus Sabulitectum sp.]
MKTGIESIAIERQRQIDAEGWTPSHDDEHVHGALSAAGASYAMNASENIDRAIVGVVDTIEKPNDWPFLPKFWKPTPKDLVRQLAKAGALIAAEIDRINRDI